MQCISSAEILYTRMQSNEKAAKGVELEALGERETGQKKVHVDLAAG